MKTNSVSTAKKCKTACFDSDSVYHFLCDDQPIHPHPYYIASPSTPPYCILNPFLPPYSILSLSTPPSVILCPSILRPLPRPPSNYTMNYSLLWILCHTFTLYTGTFLMFR